MSAPILLLSDLHLPRGPSPLRKGFARFLAGPARAASAVYILGDLFDAWIDDDEGLRAFSDEAEALHALSARGVPVYLMHGNRDFLLGARYALAAGVQLLDDPAVLDLGGCRTLLTHGDVFCTGDAGYQRWRRIVRDARVQRAYFALPAAWRKRITLTARSRSEASGSRKPKAIMDVDDNAVRRALEAHGVARMIHGHTHRPAEHAYEIGGRARERIVLADWKPERMEWLECDTEGCRRRRLPRARTVPG